MDDRDVTPRAERLLGHGGLALALVALVHLLCQFALLGESPFFFNASFFLRRVAAPALAGATLGPALAALLVAAIAGGLAFWLHRRRAVAPALLWLAVAIFEVERRLFQLQFVLDEGFVVGWPMRIGVGAALLDAFLATAVSVLALALWRRGRAPLY